MDEKTAIKLFESKKIRTQWDADAEIWYFSIVDIVAVLTETNNPRRYWSDLKIKLKEEGSELYENIVQLKLLSSDGKYYKTDVATTEQLLRLIQSIPSKKAEPFKLWLAKVGRERIDETADPEISIDRALQTYLKKGYSRDWINQRLKTIEIRKQLTDEWNRVGIEKQEDFAILTNEITLAWSGKSIKEYKQFKDLKKENLRDNMTNMELILTMLAEETTKEISREEDPNTFSQSKQIAKRGGGVAGIARKETEKELGRTVVSSKNAKEIHFKNKKQIH